MRISDWSSDVCSSDLPDDRALRDRCDGVAAPDIDIMGMTIDAVDQQIVAVTVLIGEAASDDATDDRLRIRFPGPEQAPPNPRSLEIPGGQLALHSSDEIGRAHV